VEPQTAEYWQQRSKDDSYRDWNYGEENWVKDYVKSVDHPHREILLDILADDVKPWTKLLEVGCNAGPNLIRIQRAFPEKILAGIDVNADSLEEARRHLNNPIFLEKADLLNIPWADGSFDVVLVDAVLMYIQPEDIDRAMDELERLAQQAIILVERHADTDTLRNHIWARNYTKLLETRGFTVKEIKVDEYIWPTSKSWQEFGRIYIATR
jgi:ubiquinone/menaquinone biosynthesis C-methylase UbiE